MELIKKKCLPCEGLTDPISIEEEEKYLKEITQWNIKREGIHKLSKDYLLLHFKDAISFVNDIADLAEDEGHHPNIAIFYNLVKIEIYTHAIKGLSENDFILAAKIDEIFESEYKVD